MAHEQTFRIFHRHGSVIVMAKSETDKAVWLSSLEHQMKLKKTSHLKNVTASNRIVHEVRTIQRVVYVWCMCGVAAQRGTCRQAWVLKSFFI